MAFFGNRAVDSRINDAVKFINEMAAGDYSGTIDTSVTDPFSPLMRALKRHQEILGQRATEYRLIKVALDNASTNVMIADNERHIVYANKSVNATLSKAETDLRQVLPKFNASRLIGESIEQFYSDQDHQKNLLSNLTSTHNSYLTAGSRNFSITTNPVIDEMGSRLGTIVECREWQVRAAEAEAHDAIIALVEAASYGDLTKRVPLEGKRGFLLDLSQNLNNLLDAITPPLTLATDYFKNIADGNIPPRISEEFKGEYNVLRKSINATVGILNGFYNSIIFVTAEHEKGDIDALMDTSRFNGIYKSMAEGVNNLVNGQIDIYKQTLARVKEFGEGNFDTPMEQFPGKKAFINDTIEQVRTILKNLIMDMHYMSAEHDKGDTDIIMDVGKFQGSYKVMAQGVNDMVNGHITDKMKVMACVKEFGEGNFEAQLERFPGKKAFINDIIEQVRSNLHGLINDTDMLSQAALDGRIQVRANTDKHLGDFRKIIEGINATLETIVTPIITVKSAVDSISMAAKEISAGNADLSHRTEQQAASLEKTASSMEQLASTVKQNADNAKQANQMAQAASDVASKGGGMVQQVVDTMVSINESSRKIVDIISVIDGIALQTNILALNAAVEAARAGEQGRGFAVVASEVRNLAQRSAAAAKEIKQLIGNSVEKVEDGSKLVGKAGKTMEEIVQSVKQVTDIMADIAEASAEQSSGINQVNQAVTQMDEVTQQNAALVEQAAAAAESLEEQAQTLADTVAIFQLDSNIRPTPPKRIDNRQDTFHKHRSRLTVVPGKPINTKVGLFTPNKPSDDEWTEF